MAKLKRCVHCGDVLEEGEKCGCAGAVMESQMRQGEWDPMLDDVHIRVNKQKGQEEFHREIRANSSTALIHALAVLMLLAAQMCEVSVDIIYAKVATVLFAQEDDREYGGSGK